MIKFFRLIRKQLLLENKTSRYLAYAFGEILLVVLGILIALQINNWNDARKIKKQEQQLFSKILLDLQSDSILIANALTRYKKHQDLHYHLYDEMNGKASYDSTLSYGLLRTLNNFIPLVKENYQPIVGNIINEKVREGLNSYFRVEENVVEDATVQFNNLKFDFVRPYLTAHNIIDVDALFSTSRYEMGDTRHSLNYEALRAQFNSPEFGQILFELNGRTKVQIMVFGRLMKENSRVQKVIQQALTK